MSRQKEAMAIIVERDLADMDGNYLVPDRKGLVHLYHRTSEENAARLFKTGKFKSLENRDETYFSSSLKGQAECYGTVAIEVAVSPKVVSIDDALHGEIHVTVPNRYLSRRNIVQLWIS